MGGDTVPLRHRDSGRLPEALVKWEGVKVSLRQKLSSAGEVPWIKDVCIESNLEESSKVTTDVISGDHDTNRQQALKRVWTGKITP